MIREFYSIPVDSMDYYLNESDGIIMTGGEDVNPLLYGKPDYKDLCEEPDNFRDSIEKVMIRYSFKRKIPLIGICRGQQIANAVNGGTLIPDLPTATPESKIMHRSTSDSAHLVVPTVDSWIAANFGMKTFWVNSRHHQAVDNVARGFKVAAYAPDGVVESIEIADKQLHPFVICVQWHPENLRDSVSTTLGNLFLSEIRNH